MAEADRTFGPTGYGTSTTDGLRPAKAYRAGHRGAADGRAANGGGARLARAGGGARLAGLDGLRALAVGAVIAYHVHAAWLPGGYLGVDVFFGISGFLITYLLVAEHGRRGRIALRDFWRRRAVRLLPELLLVLAACAVTARLAGGNGTGLGDGLRGDAVASLLFCSNWWQIHEGADYFHHLGTPPLLQHLWSLSVEEQFYLVWPLLLALCLPLVRGRRRSWPAAGLGVAALGGAAASLWRMHGLAAHGASGVSRAYFGTDAHSGALLAGCAAALLLPALRRAADRLPRRGLTPFCLALGVLATFAATGPGDATMYGWGFALVAAATAVVCAGCAAGAPTRLLDAAPLRLIGRHSYGLYLWHWPVVVTVNALWAASCAPAARTVAVLVPLPLAMAGQHLVQRPVTALLRRPRGHGPRPQAAAAVGKAVAEAVRPPEGGDVHAAGGAPAVGTLGVRGTPDVRPGRAVPGAGVLAPSGAGDARSRSAARGAGTLGSPADRGPRAQCAAQGDGRPGAPGVRGTRRRFAAPFAKLLRTARTRDVRPGCDGPGTTSPTSPGDHGAGTGSPAPTAETHAAAGIHGVRSECDGPGTRAAGVPRLGGAHPGRTTPAVKSQALGDRSAENGYAAQGWEPPAPPRARGVRARRGVVGAAVAVAVAVPVVSPASAPSALQRRLQAAERYEAAIAADNSPAHAGSGAAGDGSGSAGPGQSHAGSAGSGGPHALTGDGPRPGTPAGAGAPPADGVPHPGAAASGPGSAAGAGGAAGSGAVPAGGVDGSDVTMIGDSMSLGSSPDLHRLLPGIELHAEVGRMMESAPDLCARLLAAHRLRGTVVLALGTNAEFGADVLDHVRGVIGARRMVLMTVRGPFPWQDEVNAVVRAYHRDHPEVVLDDWYAAAQSHQDLLWIDHIHPRGGAGTTLFAGRLAAALADTPADDPGSP